MTFIRRKLRKSRVKKSGRVILNAKEMKELRWKAFVRSGTVCECWRIPNHDGSTPNRNSCEGRPVGWEWGHLHHIIFRSHGGSDSLDNVAFIRPECHERIHG